MNNFNNQVEVLNKSIELGIKPEWFYVTSLNSSYTTMQGRMNGDVLSELTKMGFTFVISDSNYLEGTFAPSEEVFNDLDESTIECLESIKITLT